MILKLAAQTGGIDREQRELRLRARTGDGVELGVGLHVCAALVLERRAGRGGVKKHDERAPECHGSMLSHEFPLSSPRGPNHRAMRKSTNAPYWAPMSRPKIVRHGSATTRRDSVGNIADDSDAGNGPAAARSQRHSTRDREPSTSDRDTSIVPRNLTRPRTIDRRPRHVRCPAEPFP